MSKTNHYTHFHFRGNFVDGYDAVNHVASMGMDILWRQRTAYYVYRQVMRQKLEQPQVLDLAAGTGDMAISVSRRLKNGRIIGCDPSIDMLKLGKKKNQRHSKEIHYVCAVGRLPFKDNQFDAVTCAFGMRNFVHLQRDLCEIKRMLKPGGGLYVLDFFNPTTKPIVYLLRFYDRFIFPWLGLLFTGYSRPYRYLVSSIFKFKSVTEFSDMLIKNGFQKINRKHFFLGLANLLIGSK